MYRRKWRLATVALMVMLLPTACRKTTAEHAVKPAQITFVGWGPATLRELSADKSVIEKFSQESGVPVNFIPGPESMTDRLQLYRQYLEAKSTTPDVYYIDVVWPAVLADQLADLNPFLAKEAAEELEAEVQNNTVNGRLVGMPFNTELGLLYYRADLLRKYGYDHPPQTWDELEKMAVRIQGGERAGGKRDFWGFVWQGAPFEGLTCNALEWQVSYGGGRIIEANGEISVNNPQAIAAMKKAKKWIGTISPPSVIAFKEQDARNVWNAGNAAFERDWVWRQYRAEPQEPGLKESLGVALLPGGPAGRAATLGGQSLAISKYSEHPQEAAALIRYLTSHETQLSLWKMHAMVPTRREFYSAPNYLTERPEIAQVWSQLGGIAVARPSAVSGKNYDRVSQAYFSTVHAILRGDVEAGKAMADLEKELVTITGLKPGRPQPRATAP